MSERNIGHIPDSPSATLYHEEHKVREGEIQDQTATAPHHEVHEVHEGEKPELISSRF